MSMKTAESPRRIYKRNEIVHVCFEGKTFGPTGETAFDMKYPVTCETLPSDGKRARVEVIQRKPHAKVIKETWRSVKVPSNPRA